MFILQFNEDLQMRWEARLTMKVLVIWNSMLQKQRCPTCDLMYSAHVL